MKQKDLIEETCDTILAMDKYFDNITEIAKPVVSHKITGQVTLQNNKNTTKRSVNKECSVNKKKK